MVNLGNMMKQAQQLQKKMAEAQNKLNDIEVEGTSGAVSYTHLRAHETR